VLDALRFIAWLLRENPETFDRERPKAELLKGLIQSYEMTGFFKMSFRAISFLSCS
jgi:hypothetical protein